MVSFADMVGFVTGRSGKWKPNGGYFAFTS
jgi:hypothetical protein